jgi:sugar phosphate permease
MGNILGSLIAGEYVESDWSLSFIVPGILIAVMGFVMFLFLVVRPVDVSCPLPDQVCDKTFLKLRILKTLNGHILIVENMLDVSIFLLLVGFVTVLIVW